MARCAAPGNAARVLAPPVHAASTPDAASCQWLRDLRADGAVREDAVAHLHALLLRAARFETARRRHDLPHLRDELDAIAHEATGEALVSVLSRLDDYRGDSRFTTWAYKFALLETAVRLRKLAWQRRELPRRPGEHLEHSALLSTLQPDIDNVLTEREREVLVAAALSGVPIDVVAEGLDSTRGAVYETLRDARLKLRAHLAACGDAASVR